MKKIYIAHRGLFLIEDPYKRDAGIGVSISTHLAIIIP